ncbi:MAG: MBL fold metallo-hydrolase [Magnetococcus sp. DMHC-6]
MTIIPSINDLGITLIDTLHNRPGFTASYLLEEGDQAVIIETGPPTSAPIILNALIKKGLPLTSVVAVIVTHVHLDHAGGAGYLIQHLPNARLLVHPKGARHLINPDKLVTGAQEVYGENIFNTLLGYPIPVANDRIDTPAEGDTFTFNNRTLTFLHTLGHSKHHFCIWDEQTSSIFTGDTHGISYRAFDSPKGIFLFPATTPVHFDPDAAHHSIDRIAALKPQWLHFTHFGSVPYNRTLSDDLHRLLDRIRIFAKAQDHPLSGCHTRLAAGIEKILFSRLNRLGNVLSRAESQKLLFMDIQLNALGLEHWINSLASTPKGEPSHIITT